MKLAVVIVHYNTSADLQRCLESLAANAPSCDHQVIVVDNASRDPGLPEVHRRFASCRWIFNTENLGYAKGCNLGMREVEAEYYLVLNPDIVVQPGALDRLLEFAAANPRAGIVGPQLLNEDGSIQDSCRRFYTFATLLLRRTFLGRLFPGSRTVQLHLMRDFDHRGSRPVDWILGGCLLARRSAVLRTGPMDERFFLYFEDVDWCYRMWQAGWEVLYTPDARFQHRHRRDSARSTFNRSFWMHLGSLISFYEKWGILVWLLKKWRDSLLVFLLWLMDMAGAGAAFGLAYGARSLLGARFPEPLYPFAEYRGLLVFTLLLATLVFSATGRYRAEEVGAPRATGKDLQRVGIVFMVLLASTYLGNLDVISRAVLLIFLPLLAGAVVVTRLLLARVLRRLAEGGFSLERTLLVGRPAGIQAWLAEAGDLGARGVDLVGYAWDTDGGGGLPPLAGGMVPCLGGRGDLLEIVRRYRISQVVFWDLPEPELRSARIPEALAALRRLRVRLRWHMPRSWLLAAGTRAEWFAGELSAVQGPRPGAAARALGRRAEALAAGAALAGLSALPWLWLKSVAVPRGRASLVEVRGRDPWGYDPRLLVAVGRGGGPLPLPWQRGLASALLRGRIALTGPFPVQGAADPAEDPQLSLELWQGEPRPPALTGPWAGSAGGDSGRHLGRWSTLWRRPGGIVLQPGSGQHSDAKVNRS